MKTKRLFKCPGCDGRKQRYSKLCNRCNGRIRAKAGLTTTRLTHGHASNYRYTPEYTCWHAIKQRCLNPQSPEYHRYGGRGITIADEWRHDFVAFLNHVGRRPDGYSLDRIDNDGNYKPGNVRWATRTEQLLNTRASLRLRRVMEDGSEEPISLEQAAAFVGLSYSALRIRFVAAGILPQEKWKQRRIEARK